MYRITSDSPTGGYYCIDGTGFHDEIAFKPDGTQCDPEDEPINKFLLQAEQLMFPDSSKLARRYYEENQQSYVGMCASVVVAMKDSGLDISCISENDRYRVSARLSDGTYQCISESIPSPKVDFYSPEFNVSLTEEPQGFNCS